MRTACLALLAAVAAMAGAASGQAKKEDEVDVRGKVSYKGKPLPGGTISLVPEKGKRVVAALQADGTYATKAAAGKYRVLVETESAKKPAKAKDKADKTRYVAIPKKYGDVKTSVLTFEVKPSVDNEFVLELAD
jgi:hypothetical protein